MLDTIMVSSGVRIFVAVAFTVFYHNTPSVSIEIRKNKHYTQQYLADKIGVEQSAVAMWETGKSMPSMKNLLKLADVLEIGLEDCVAALSKKEKPS